MKDDVAIIPASQANDDDLWAPLDTSNGPKHIAGDLGQVAEEEFSPEEIAEAGLVPQEEGEFEDPVPASFEQPEPEEVVEEGGDEVIDIPGGTVTISHDSKGWHGILESEDGGGKEVFHGKTQKELMTNVLAGKLNATRQIRKLNKKLKLGTPVAAEPAPATPVKRELTANEIFEIKTALETNPDAAFESWFQKKFNLSAEQLVQLAKRGAEAHEELTVESVSKEFLESHSDDYYPWDENGYNIMCWLVKNKLHRPVRQSDNFGTISAELLSKGLYTVENLEEAFEDLTDSGLLLPPPSDEVEEEEIETPAPPATTTVVAPAPRRQPKPPSTRIASTRRRPRASLGIRPGSVSTSQPTPTREPSVEDLDNLSDNDLQGLWNSVRRTSLQKGRR